MMRSGAALARLAQRGQAGGIDTCELCGVPLPGSHRHLLDLQDEQLRCVCRACALLFEREAAARGHYRLVPQRRIRLEPTDVDGGAPVGLAFYIRGEDGTVVVRYPSPLGITSGIVDDAAWSVLARCWPQVAEMTPSVEALLLNTARTSSEHWIVPIEDCYRLVAVIREHWTGLSGGREVWPAITAFFDDLRAPAAGRITVGAGP